jgi:hypothetical protein
MSAASRIVQGRRVVTTPGTPVQMSTTSQSAVQVRVRALTTNTNNVALGGDNTVRAAAGSETGVVLKATDPSIVIEVDDVTDLWVDAVTAGEGVVWMATVS